MLRKRGPARAHLRYLLMKCDNTKVIHGKLHPPSPLGDSDFFFSLSHARVIVEKDHLQQIHCKLREGSNQQAIFILNKNRGNVLS